VITVCILAKNSQRSLFNTLASLRRFNEIVLLDTGSTDQTIAIAQTFPNIVVRQTSFSGFGHLRNQAAEIAKHDWILAVDSDEVLSPALEEEILSLSLNPDCVYEIDFWNYYNGKRILGCGWHPERHIRLYHRRTTQFSRVSLHEGIIREKSIKTIRLKHPIYHTPYRSTFDFISKMQLYSDLFAEQHRGKRTSSFSKALGHALGALLKSYILKRGFLMGKEGAIISWYNANVAFYKYLKLAEANQNHLLTGAVKK
jgi:glycosyltransferase involved in cell wall biosynthesis